jgi:CrcB protein
MLFKNFLIAGFGGFLGTLLRYAVTLLIKPGTFPAATFLINVTGSFILGLVIGYTLKFSPAESNLRLFLATGFCGGFTTFSTFSYENVSLLKSGHYSYFFLYVAGSLVIGIFATWLGLLMMK